MIHKMKNFFWETEPRKPPIIGVSLEELYERDTQIPVIIVECIQCIRQGITTEGLFRVPGDSQKMKDLINELKMGKYQFFK